MLRQLISFLIIVLRSKKILTYSKIYFDPEKNYCISKNIYFENIISKMQFEVILNFLLRTYLYQNS